MAVVVPDISEIMEDAYERAGLEMRSGYDLRTARRSFNLLTLEWQNRGLNLFSVEGGTMPLVSGTSEYTMPTDTIDLIEHHVRIGSGTSQVDTQLERISVSTYAKTSTKNLSSRPTQIYVHRGADNVTATIWPVPDSNDYTLVYYRLKGTDGLASGIGTSAAVPPRFIPALVAGLAYHIAMKKPQVADRVAALKQEYEFQFTLAAGEDEDRASWFLIPAGGY